jgi:hypothetical protein
MRRVNITAVAVSLMTALGGMAFAAETVTIKVK